MPDVPTPRPCIYCQKYLPLSDEHWFPRAFGTWKGYQTLKERVCEGCNQATALAEQAFAQYGMNGIPRAMLGKKGRKKHKQGSSPFTTPLKDIPPLEVLAPHPEYPCDAYMEPQSEGVVRPLFQAILKESDRHFSLRIPDRLEVVEEICEFLKQHLTPGRMIVHIDFPEHKRTLVEGLVKALPAAGIGKSARMYEVTPDVRQRDATLKFTVSSLHARAAAKIGFHYMLKYWDDMFGGDEPQFGGIRDFIMGRRPRDEDWHVFVQLTKDGIGIVGGVPSHYGHVVGINRDEALIQARLRLFIGEKWLPHTWRVNIGKPPGRIIVPRRTGHFFRYFEEPTDGFDGELLDQDLHSGLQLPPGTFF